MSVRPDALLALAGEDGGAAGDGPTLHCAPSDLHARGLLPHDEVAVVSSHAPFAPLHVGRVWPSKRVAPGRVRIDAPEGVLRATATVVGASVVAVPSAAAANSPSAKPGSPRTPGKAAAAAAASAAAALQRDADAAVASVHLVRLAEAWEGGTLVPATSVHVVRHVQHLFAGGAPTEGRSSAPPRRGGASLVSIRALLQGAVLPLDGGITLTQGDDAASEGGFVNTPTKGAVLNDARAPEMGARASATALLLLPTTITSSTEGSCSPLPRFTYVTRTTQFIEGRPLSATLPAALLKVEPRLPLGGSNVVGGLETQLEALIELATSALSESFAALGLPLPRGALLSGPPGTGKTLLAQALASALCVPLIVVNGGELLSGGGGGSGSAEACLRALWRDATEGVGWGGAPLRGAILFLDEVDALCGTRGDARGGFGEEARLLGMLIALMDHGLPPMPAAATAPGIDSLPPPGRVFVLGATNRPMALDAALRRPGRFDREIVVGVPTAAQRGAILSVCLSGYSHSISEGDLMAIARTQMHGFVGADIAAACAEGAMVTLRRWRSAASGEGAYPLSCVDDDYSLATQLGALGLSDSHAVARAGSEGGPSPSLHALPSPTPSPLTMTLLDLREGIRHVQPSALREVAVEVPDTPWSAIAGQEQTKAALREAIEWPALYGSTLFAALGIRPPRGVLLYGPPGCSKTLCARAMATSSASNFIAVKGPELFSMYVGDSEKAVARVFARARAAAPCVIFFDEFDSLGATRGGEGSGSGGVGARVVAQLLQELDGVSSSGAGAGEGVIVVAATNRPDLIDPALLRPGRIDRLLHVGLPDEPARTAIARAHLSRVPHDKGGVTPEAVGAATEGFSGAEAVAILRDAGLRAVQDALARVTSGVGDEGSTSNTSTPPLLSWAHIAASIAATPRGVTQEMKDFYAAFESRTGGHLCTQG